MGRVRELKGGSGWVVDGARPGEMARLRSLGDGRYALATQAAPGTLPVEITIEADALREFVEHIRWELDGPRFPAGTPEHEAYAAELREELAKWAAGVQPYPYDRGATP